LSKREYKNKHTYPLIRENGRQTPRIPVRIINFDTGESELTTALIDTGSDSCVFPSYITTSIGYKLDDKDKRKIGIKGISGVELDCYVHGFTIQILDSSKTHVLSSIDTIAYTVTNDNLTPILGTYRFLEFLQITIDYTNEEIIIRW